MNNVSTHSPIDSQLYDVFRIHRKATGFPEKKEYEGKPFAEAQSLVSMLNQDEMNDITAYFVCRPQSSK